MSEIPGYTILRPLGRAGAVLVAIAVLALLRGWMVAPDAKPSIAMLASVDMSQAKDQEGLGIAGADTSASSPANPGPTPTSSPSAVATGLPTAEPPSSRLPISPAEPLAASASSYKHDYAGGLQAAQESKWSEVRSKMQSAISKEPAPVARLKLYGMRYEPYVPRFYLGLAAFRQSDCVEAVANWVDPATRSIVQSIPSLSDLADAGLAECKAGIAHAQSIAMDAPTPSATPRAMVAAAAFAAAGSRAFKTSYARGLDAARSGNWAEVEARMRAAFAIQPTPARRMQLYGLRYEPYVPKLFLGIAAYKRGDCVIALPYLQDTATRAALGSDEEFQLADYVSVSDQALHECRQLGADPVSAGPPPRERIPALAFVPD